MPVGPRKCNRTPGEDVAAEYTAFATPGESFPAIVERGREEEQSAVKPGNGFYRGEQISVPFLLHVPKRNKLRPARVGSNGESAWAA